MDTPNGDNSRIALGNIARNRGESAYDQPLSDTLTIIYDLPYGRDRMFGAGAGRALQTLLGDWQVSFINSATSGQPINLTYNPSDIQRVSDLLTYRPNVSGNPVTPEGQRIKTPTSVSNFLNTATVSVPTDVSQPYGNAGRNSLLDYGYYSLDSAIHKGFRLWNEASILDFRAEAFNVLNQVNYGPPNSNRSSGGFGSITQAFPPRQLQLALKLSF